MVRTYTSSDGKLEVLGLGEDFLCSVTRVEWRGDQDFGIDDVLLELGVFAFLVRGDLEEMMEVIAGDVCEPTIHLRASSIE